MGVCLTVSLRLSFFFFSSRRRHTRCSRDWSSDVCSSDLKSSPKLFQAITTGKHFPNAVLTALKAGGDKAVDYMKIEFDQLFLVDLHESGSSGNNDVPRESINFAFGKVTVTYNEQKADGTKGAATVATYDFKKHVSG